MARPVDESLWKPALGKVASSSTTVVCFSTRRVERLLNDDDWTYVRVCVMKLPQISDVAIWRRIAGGGGGRGSLTSESECFEIGAALRLANLRRLILHRVDSLQLQDPVVRRQEELVQRGCGRAAVVTRQGDRERERESGARSSLGASTTHQQLL